MGQGIIAGNKKGTQPGEYWTHKELAKNDDARAEPEAESEQPRNSNSQ